MTRDEFREKLAHRLEPDFRKIYGPLVHGNSLHGCCMEFVFDTDHNVAFHAAYALEATYEMDRESFARAYGRRFVADFPRVTDPSVQRHYAKIMSDLLQRRLVAPAGREVDDIIEKSFDMLISETAKPAVKVWAMEVLYLMSDRRDWVAGALYETIQDITADCGAGLGNRGAKVSRKLKVRLDSNQ